MSNLFQEVEEDFSYIDGVTDTLRGIDSIIANDYAERLAMLSRSLYRDFMGVHYLLRASAMSTEDRARTLSTRKEIHTAFSLLVEVAEKIDTALDAQIESPHDAAMSLPLDLPAYFTIVETRARDGHEALAGLCKKHGLIDPRHGRHLAIDMLNTGKGIGHSFAKATLHTFVAGVSLVSLGSREFCSVLLALGGLYFVADGIEDNVRKARNQRESTHLDRYLASKLPEGPDLSRFSF